MVAVRQSTKFIVLHCSATPASHDVDAKEIDRWHRQKGWLMIGYHFVIKRDGTVQKGRDLNVAGAHVEGMNHCSIGICLVGGMNASNTKPENNFEPVQWTALKALLTEMTTLFPQAQIIGHYELQPAKACPSFNVPAFLSAWAKEQTTQV